MSEGLLMGGVILILILAGSYEKAVSIAKLNETDEDE
jgi:hypothetical protein